MPDYQLPANWCINRTDEHFSAINDWLNKKFNNPTAYEKAGGYITNKTERGVHPVLTKKPKDLVEITFEQFSEHVLGIKKAANLPKYWVVKQDESEDFKKVIEYVNVQGKTNYKGKSNCYYGFDGIFKCLFELDGFTNKPTVLTSAQLLSMIEDIPAKAQGNRPAAPQAEVAVRPVRVQQPPLFEVAPVANVIPVNGEVLQGPNSYLAGYQLLRRYPGSQAVGSVTLNIHAFTVVDALYEDRTFWRPIYLTLPQVGGNVEVITNPNGLHMVPGFIVTVISVALDADNNLCINFNFNGGLRRAPARFFRTTAALAEVPIPGTQFICVRQDNSLLIKRGGENNRVLITKQDLERFKALNSDLFNVRIGNIGEILTTASIDQMLQLL